jgi:hypothetical protein
MSCLTTCARCRRPVALPLREQIEALHWLHDRGFVCDEWTVQAAAANGDLETLQWLRSLHVPWLVDVSAAFART